MSSTTRQHATYSQSYFDRASLPNTSPVAAYLLRLIEIKKTNLCVSADVNTTRELLQLAEDVGDSICLLKTHADIINDFGPRTIEGLKEVASRKKFLVFEDRKFGDIGSTVQKQFTAGPLQIIRWANIVNAHIFPGPAIIRALSEAASGAVHALNTQVTTSISASPAVSYNDDSDQGSRSPRGGRYEDDDDVDEEGCEGTFTEEDEEEPDDYHEFGTFDDRNARKPSVVSVSTTISTKTESISPQPTSTQTYTSCPSSPVLSRHEEPNQSAAFARLGQPPLLRSLLLLAEMSSAGNLMTGSYTEQCVVEARKFPEFVMGFISQRSLNELPEDNFVTMTPGVQIGSTGDGLGQQYNTPEKVIETGTDVIIVGRGIYGAADKLAAAEEYRQRAWKAYESRIANARKVSR
ncbi:hypothetical protein AAFC00_003030 [Neodothiora populina]|uniref:Orotidine 5'-phosphate decarboxylase n=1 Tax=Neodothiora populina TaxID=2781224 RepID=A0ABR3P958_9PEZI